MSKISMEVTLQIEDGEKGWAEDKNRSKSGACQKITKLVKTGHAACNYED